MKCFNSKPITKGIKTMKTIKLSNLTYEMLVVISKKSNCSLEVAIEKLIKESFKALK